MKKLLLCVLPILFIVGCSTNSTDEFERTFPEAFSLETATIQQLINDEIVAPDSLNFDVYVTDINVCPKNNLCIGPDGIFISETPASENKDKVFHIDLVEPRQFTEGERYTLSLGLTLNSSGTRKRVNLIGYSEFDNQPQ